MAAAHIGLDALVQAPPLPCDPRPASQNSRATSHRAPARPFGRSAPSRHPSRASPRDGSPGSRPHDRDRPPPAPAASPPPPSPTRPDREGGAQGRSVVVRGDHAGGPSLEIKKTYEKKHKE